MKLRLCAATPHESDAFNDVAAKLPVPAVDVPVEPAVTRDLGPVAIGPIMVALCGAAT